MKGKEKPLISLVMIVKNEEEILGKCLEHVKDIVDDYVIVDTGSTDKTKDIIAKYGEIFEIPFEDFVTTKNKALEIADGRSNYILFMDADEVLYEGKDILRKIAHKGEIDCVSCEITEGPPEDYSIVGNKYQRPRLWKNNKEWKFFGKKVHEYVACENKKRKVSVVDGVLVRHEHLKQNKKETARERFLQYVEWLTDAVKEDPMDQRSLFYLARTYKDLDMLEEAIIVYEEYLQIDSNEYEDEKWQAAYDIAFCYMCRSDFKKALKYCGVAENISSKRAEHNTLAGYVYYTRKEWENAIKEYSKALEKPIPKDVVLFLHPHDYNVVPNDYLSICYYNIGEFKKSLDCLNKNKDIQDEWHTSNRYWYERRNSIPIWMVAGNTPEPIWGGILNEKGVHGIETAFIEVSKNLVKLGHKVFLFCNTEKEHEYEGVWYIPFWKIGSYIARKEYHPDFIITAREFETLFLNIPAIKIFWQQDVHIPQQDMYEGFEERIDAIVCPSIWHKDNMIQTNIKLNPNKMFVIPYGIDKQLYSIKKEKERFKVMYNSNPDRGLDTLIDMWEEITDRIPEINLYITYGWDSKETWGEEENKQAIEHKEKIMDRIKDFNNIIFTGRLNKKELAHHQQTAEVLVYPCNFYETFCISALEAQAAGMVVLTSNIGALSTTVIQNNNYLLTGIGGNIFYNKKFINTLDYILNNPKELRTRGEDNRDSIMNGKNDWMDIAKIWEELFFTLLKGR